MKYFCFILLLGAFTSSFAQQNKEISNERAKEVFNELNRKLDGTYQIQFNDGFRLQPSISYEMLKEIEAKRDEHNTVYIDYNKYYRIKVLSYSEIRSADFKPIKEKVVYTTN